MTMTKGILFLFIFVSCSNVQYVPIPEIKLPGAGIGTPEPTAEPVPTVEPTPCPVLGKDDPVAEIIFYINYFSHSSHFQIEYCIYNQSCNPLNNVVLQFFFPIDVVHNGVTYPGEKSLMVFTDPIDVGVKPYNFTIYYGNIVHINDLDGVGNATFLNCYENGIPINCISSFTSDPLD